MLCSRVGAQIDKIMMPSGRLGANEVATHSKSVWEVFLGKLALQTCLHVGAPATAPQQCTQESNEVTQSLTQCTTASCGA